MFYYWAILLFTQLNAFEPNLSQPKLFEMISLHHDDNGFAPLIVPCDTYTKLKQNHNEYIQRLKLIFAEEMRGHETSSGIHMPNWLIWGFPSVDIQRNKLTLFLSNQSLTNPLQIGSLDLVSNNLTVLEGLTKIQQFLKKYIDYDHLSITRYPFSLKKIEFSAFWTEIDDLVLQMVIKGANYHLTPEERDTDEILRLIGEFFRWRKIIQEFCTTSNNHVNDMTLPIIFEKFLISKHKFSSEMASIYKSLLSLRRQQLGLTLIDPIQSQEVVDHIFENFVVYGLTHNHEQSKRYQEQLFPK